MNNHKSNLKEAEIAATKANSHKTKTTSSPATSHKTENHEELSQKFSERDHIQKILHRAKVYSTVFLIVELVGLFLCGFYYMSVNHPYFTSSILPDFLQNFLIYLSVWIVAPAVFMTPVVLVLYAVFALAAIFCLIISIRLFQKWQALQVPDQDYRLAKSSIIVNIIALIPAVILFIIIIAAFFKIMLS